MTRQVQLAIEITACVSVQFQFQSFHWKFENARCLQPEQLLDFCTPLFEMELYATLTTKMQICTLMHSTLYKYAILLIHVQYGLSHSLNITRQACWLLYEHVVISSLHQAGP